MPSSTKKLIISIGGTGTKIAWTAAQKWGGNIPRNVSIVLIDSHTDRPELRVPQSVYSGSEQIDYPMEWARLKNDEMSGLREWWPSRVQPEPRVGFQDGCGAIRANGRFFAFRHADYIVDAIDDGIGRLAEADRLGVDGQRDDLQWEVYILCSLGNGTGGGCFMEVAAMVKDMLRIQGFKNPMVTGLFVPGSVTRYGSVGKDRDAMENQVAASGLGSFVELQYEFNRNSSKAFRPSAPYLFKAWCGGQFREFRPDRGAVNSEDQARGPYDYALILDRVNKRSVRNDYDDLIDSGAEALKSLVGGADADSRLLDLQIKCKEGRRFGSLGVMALEAPTSLLIDYSTYKMLLAALTWGANDVKLDPELNADFLTDSLPAGGERLGADDITVEKSVDFFLDKVLDVKEAGPDAKRQNDLFRRFEAADEELTITFNMAQGEGGLGLGEVDRGQVVERADTVLNHVLALAQDLPGRREQALRELWERTPPPDCKTYADLDSLEEAGIRWRLEQRVARFVERGAFGPLTVWLDELKRQVDANVLSIYETEVKDHLGGKDRLSAQPQTSELEKVIKELKEKANSVFSVFQKSAIADKATETADRAAEAFGFLLWQSKINAVLKFYTWLEQHVDMLSSGARAAAKELSSETILNEIERNIQGVEKKLAGKGGGERVVFLGCDDDVRSELLASLEEDASTRSRTLLQARSELMWEVFGSALKDDGRHVQILIDALGESRAEELVRMKPGVLRDRLEHELTESVRKRVAPAVVTRTDLDDLLVREARAKIRTWYELYYSPNKRSMPLDQTAQDARLALEWVVGKSIDEIVDFIEKYDGDFERAMYYKKDGRIDGAVMVFVRARVANLIGAALPLWNPVDLGNITSVIQETAFFTHNTQAIHIAQALDDQANLPVAKRLEVKAQSSQFYPAFRVECVSVALGGELEWFARGSEVNSYRLAMDGLPEAPEKEPWRTWFSGYNPHTTREYEEIGKLWLEQWGEKTTGRDGELVVALAELQMADYPDMLGFIERRGAHFYLRKPIVEDYEDGERKFSTFATGLVAGKPNGPKGVVYFTDWIEGKDRAGFSGKDGRGLAGALKEKLWKDLDCLIRGGWMGDDQQIVPLGRQEVVRRINARAAELRSEQGGGQEVEARHAQGEALQRLADALMKSKGERPSFLRS